MKMTYTSDWAGIVQSPSLPLQWLLGFEYRPPLM